MAKKAIMKKRNNTKIFGANSITLMNKTVIVVRMYMNLNLLSILSDRVPKNIWKMDEIKEIAVINKAICLVST